MCTRADRAVRRPLRDTTKVQVDPFGPEHERRIVTVERPTAGLLASARTAGAGVAVAAGAVAGTEDVPVVPAPFAVTVTARPGVAVVVLVACGCGAATVAPG